MAPMGLTMPRSRRSELLPTTACGTVEHVAGPPTDPPDVEGFIRGCTIRCLGYSQLKNDSVVLSLITIPLAIIRGFAYVELAATS
jgi:hypothetical protein